MGGRGVALLAVSILAGGCLAIAGLDGDYVGSEAQGVNSASTVSTSMASGENGAAGSAPSSSSIGGSGGSGGAHGPVCGNDAVEAPEECDDGGTDALDGCSATCTKENLDSCEAAPIIELADQQSITVAGDLTGAADDITNSPGAGECSGGTAYGPDHVWALVPQANGTLSLSLSASYDSHWTQFRDSCPGTADLECDYSSSMTILDDFTLTVSMGVTYYVIVNSYNSIAGGPYMLTLQLN